MKILNQIETQAVFGGYSDPEIFNFFMLVFIGIPFFFGILTADICNNVSQYFSKPQNPANNENSTK